MALLRFDNKKDDTKRERSEILDSGIELDAIMQRYVEVAGEVLDECRNALMMSYRFLDVALWKMPYAMMSSPWPLGTNGAVLLFTPQLVLDQFEEFPNEIVRDYLHTQIHCILRHPFDTEHENREAWSLCSDIITESIAIEMSGKRFSSDLDSQRLEAIDRLTLKLNGLTPGKLYRAIKTSYEDQMEGRRLGLSPAYLWDLKMIFERDCHDFWAVMPKEQSQEQQEGEGSQGDGEENKMGMPQQQDASQNNGSRNGSNESDDQGSDFGDESNNAAADELQNILDEDERWSNEEEWKEISKQIETDLESFSEAWGKEAGNLMTTLAITNYEQHDYADFLRKFATITEEMKINDDEFDYIYYTYSLTHYDKTLLVEPLEYMETNRIRDFVIAIDTSGSTAGELVEKFLTRTYEILHQTEGFSDHINVHIIQCDAKVQEDVKVKDIREMDEYIKSLTIKGHGGTDFRPVFAYVDELLEQGEFDNLCGLIYFTDGQGTCPITMPSYDTAFVFLDDKFDRHAVPPWAMRVVLDEDQVREL